MINDRLDIVEATVLLQGITNGYYENIECGSKDETAYKTEALGEFRKFVNNHKETIENNMDIYDAVYENISECDLGAEGEKLINSIIIK